MTRHEMEPSEPMHYRFIEVEGEEDDLERVANEWRAKGYQLFQAVYKTTYRWVLVFELRDIGL